MEGGQYAVVSAATGALGPVVAKLTALLGAEYELLEGSRSDIEVIRSKMEPLHTLLLKICDWHEVVDASDDSDDDRSSTERERDLPSREWWAVQARELSYDAEDAIDSFMLGLERGLGGFVEKTGGGTGSPAFQDLRIQAEELGNQWRPEWGIAAETIISSNHGKSTVADPRDRFLHEDEWELMEMGQKEEELIQLLDASMLHQQLRTVCVLGFAGMGKTTLVDQVYRKMTAEGQGRRRQHQSFEYRAFVSVCPSPDVVGVLGAIVTQLDSKNAVATAARATDGVTTTQQHLAKEISNILADKRYLLIVDDIWHWEHWEIIRQALPDNNLGSRIIITTRNNAIAEKCRRENGAAVYSISGIQIDAAMLLDAILRRSVADITIEFGEDKPCHDIVQMCRGMPLSLVCMSSALAERLREQDDLEDDLASWWSVSYILDGFLSIPSLKPLVHSLSLGYNDLTIRLRTCLLYCSIYPDGHKIERDHLVRKWIAEGLVHQEEAAETCFDELVARNMLHRTEGGGGNNRYEVHPVMLAFLVSKSTEANFVTRGSSYAGRSFCPYLHGPEIRRLTLSYRSRANFSGMDVRRTRSLVVFDAARRVPFARFVSLRVLDLEYSKGLKDADLVEICGLQTLRYLGLKGTPITQLPGARGDQQTAESGDPGREKHRGQSATLGARPASKTSACAC